MSQISILGIKAPLFEYFGVIYVTGLKLNTLLRYYVPTTLLFKCWLLLLLPAGRWWPVFACFPLEQAAGTHSTPPCHNDYSESTLSGALHLSAHPRGRGVRVLRCSCCCCCCCCCCVAARQCGTSAVTLSMPGADSKHLSCTGTTVTDSLRADPSWAWRCRGVLCAAAAAAAAVAAVADVASAASRCGMNAVTPSAVHR